MDEEKINPNTTAGEVLRLLREVIFTSPDPKATDKATVQFEQILTQITQFEHDLLCSEFVSMNLPGLLQQLFEEKGEK